MKVAAIIFLMVQSMLAQELEIVQAECFIDVDPGAGSGIQLDFTPLAADCVTVLDSVNVSALAVGDHRIYYRFRDSAGKWSSAFGKPFHVSAPIPAGDQTVTDAECYVDGDPGAGNGIQLDSTPAAADCVTVLDSLDVSALAVGDHRIYYRVRDSGGKWSNAFGKPFHVSTPIPDGARTVVAAEYYFDADPGVEYGTSLGFTPASSDCVTVSSGIDVSALAPGDHELGIRFVDNGGVWSKATKRRFRVAEPLAPMSNVVAGGEFGIDAIPPVGSGILLHAEDGDFDEQEEELIRYRSGSEFSPGTHFVYMRARDARGLWSPILTDSFVVVSPASITLVSRPTAGADSVRLYWTNFPGATGYAVRYDSTLTGFFSSALHTVAAETTMTVATPPVVPPQVRREFFEVQAELPDTLGPP